MERVGLGGNMLSQLRSATSILTLNLVLACTGAEKSPADKVIQEYNISTLSATYRLGFLCSQELDDKVCPSLDRLVYVGRGGIQGSLSSAVDSTLVTDLQYCPPYSNPHFDCYEGLAPDIKFNAWQLYINSSGFDVGYNENLNTVKSR